MSAANNRKVCSVCGRARSKHDPPFGKNCKLVPLSEDEKLRVLEQIEKAERDEQEKLKNLEESELDKQLAELQAKKAQVEADEKKQQELLKTQEESLRKKQKAEELVRLQQEMNMVLSRVEDVQARLVIVSSELDKSPESEPVSAASATTPAPAPVATLPVTTTAIPVVPAATLPAGVPASPAQLMPPPATTAVPVARAPPGFPQQPPSTVSVNPLTGALDPSMQIYANALAAQAQAQTAVPTGTDNAANNGALGATALQLMQENPYLAAAAGIQQLHLQKKRDEGKLIAENFVNKGMKDRDKLTYKEFIHGALKMIMRRVKYENKPVLDLLVYYERLANFACQFPWPAVLDYHEYMTNEVVEERKSWATPVEFEDAVGLLTGDKGFKRPAGSDGDRSRDRRPHGGGGRYRPASVSGGERHNDGYRDRGYRSMSADGDRPICKKYNGEMTGCDFGKRCQYRHECSDCENRGVVACHPALWCPWAKVGVTAHVAQAPPTGHGGQAGHR